MPSSAPCRHRGVSNRTPAVVRRRPRAFVVKMCCLSIRPRFIGEFDQRLATCLEVGHAFRKVQMRKKDQERLRPTDVHAGSAQHLGCSHQSLPPGRHDSRPFEGIAGATCPASARPCRRQGCTDGEVRKQQNRRPVGAARGADPLIIRVSSNRHRLAGAAGGRAGGGTGT